MSKFGITIVLGTAVCLALACTAEANILGTVVAEHDGYGANSVTQVYGGGLYGTYVYGGVYMLDKSSGTGLGNYWPDDSLIPAFCIELNEDAPATATNYDVVNPADVHNNYLNETLGATKANYLRELWGRFYNPAWADGGYYSNDEKHEAEAFAAAVWEIIYEDLPGSPQSWDVSSDGTWGSHGFRANNLDASLANSWLHALTGSGPMADLCALVSDGQQDYLVQVPEPATLIMFGIGGLFSLLRRRRTVS
jgi:hypothetical protein